MNILIISHYIAPIQAVASIRWTKITKYLKREHEDINITIVTDEKNFEDVKSGIPLSKVDPLLQEDEKNFDDVIEVPYGKLYKIYKKLLYSYKIKKNKNIEYHKNSIQSVGVKKGFKQRIKEAESFFRVDYIENRVLARRICKGIEHPEQYDVVISTYSPAWTHLVAKKIKARNSNVMWIADFRDSYADDIADCPLAFKYHKNFVRKHCIKADVLTRINDELVLFEEKFQKTETVYNGYDLDEKTKRITPKRFSFTYTGILEGDERNFSELFHAVKELIDENIILKDDIEFSYAGTSGSVFTSQAEKYQMEQYVHDYGLLKREDAIRLQNESLFLLMANANTETLKCEWSGKMYEYMMAEKPIIYFVAGTVPYSLPSKNIDKLGGCCYEYLRHEELYPQLKNYIKSKYTEWKENGDVTLKRDAEYVEMFSYSNIAGRIWKIIEDGGKK